MQLLKSFFSSKLNWLGVIQVLMGSLELASNIQHPSYQGIINLVIGILTIILRTFFTSKPITNYAADSQS